MNSIEITLKQIRQALINNVDTKSLASSNRFFKQRQAAKVHGVKMAVVHMIAKTTFQQIKAYPKQAIFELCEELWKSGYLEESTIACKWAEWLYKEYEPADFTIFERWLSNYVTNWVDCDTLCRQLIVLFVMRFPDYIVRLKEWAKSPNRWMRRGAAVSLIIPVQKGFFWDDVFEIANILLTDKDDMVQKGYGWLLKEASEASEAHQIAVFDFVLKNKSVMPRTALRYAIKKMPEDMKTEAMKIEYNFQANNQELLDLIDIWEPKLMALDDNDVVVQRRNSQNRNIKQIVGHMVDSASNNKHRIVHLQYQPSPFAFPDYANLGNNDRWIAIQNYETENWTNLVQLWKYTNLHIIHVINHVNEEKLDNQWTSAKGENIFLKDMIIDYLQHFKLHLGEIEELITTI